MTFDEANLLKQHHGEPIDFFAMRAFLVAFSEVDDNAARAMIHWIADKGFSELYKRQCAAHSPEGGK
jgi:hypothetical protein